MAAQLAPAGEPVGISVLGSTGSIGISTLDVLRRHPERYRVVSLSAHHQVDTMFRQCLEFRPRQAVMVEPDAARRLSELLRDEGGIDTEVLTGAESLEIIASAPESRVVMAAIVGAAGLLSTLAAARTGKRILLANKEALVMSGALLMNEVRRSGAKLLPIDSEHNAIFQCMPPNQRQDLAQTGVRRIVLTASGGPFRETPLDELANVTPEQACTHPNWDMGRKISVDSATMMNKGLELIEACWLFDAKPEQVEIVIHPQSVVHSMVAYHDGSVLAQLGNPDMRTPIAHALAWPERIDSGVDALDLVQVGQLTFQNPDRRRFPCLALAEAAAREGGAAAIAMNAANEVAVSAFLAGDIGFTDIPAVVGHTLSATPSSDAASIEQILASDAAARQRAGEHVDQIRSTTV